MHFLQVNRISYDGTSSRRAFSGSDADVFGSCLNAGDVENGRAMVLWRCALVIAVKTRSFNHGADRLPGTTNEEKVLVVGCRKPLRVNERKKNLGICIARHAREPEKQ